jgi:hypothetical protein
MLSIYASLSTPQKYSVVLARPAIQERPRQPRAQATEGGWRFVASGLEQRLGSAKAPVAGTAQQSIAK